MALEVGRIVARVEGETADFEKKMAGAQRTFQVTAQKLDASAQQLANSLKKTYSDRVVAANATAQREIEAARRSMQERLRLTQSSAEVAAVREQFNRRAAAASAGARSEVQAAQQQYLVASQGLRPVITAGEQLTKTAANGRTGLLALRGAVTSMAASALSAAPGVTQLSAVLGSMAIGAPLMIGALAGMAALGFAWEKITGKAKEAKEEQEKAIEAARKIRMGALGTEIEQLAAAEARRDQTRAALAEAERGRTVTFRGGTRTIIDQGAILQLTKDLREAEKAVQTFRGVIKEANTEGMGRVADDAANAAESFDRLVQSGREINRELTESLRKLVEIHDEGALAFRQRDLLRGVLPARGTIAGRGLITRPGVVGSPMPRSVQLSADTEMKRWADRVRKAAAETTDALSGAVKKMFDPKMIISGLATSGISVISSALLDIGADLLGFSSKASEAARAMREAQKAFKRSVQDFIDSFLPDAQRMEQQAVRTAQDFFDAFRDTHRPRFDDPRAGMTKAIDAAFENARSMTEVISLLVLLKNLFPEWAAEIDKMITAAGLAAGALDKTAEAADKMVEALTNVPQGFKIERARFNATMAAAGFSGPNPEWMINHRMPSVATPTGTSAGRTVTQSIHIDRIEMSGVNDPQQFLDRLETEIMRRKARGGSGISLEYL